jgi:hypothetical protein
MSKVVRCDMCGRGEQPDYVAGWLTLDALGLDVRTNSDWALPLHFCGVQCAVAAVGRMATPAMVTTGEQPRRTPVVLHTSCTRLASALIAAPRVRITSDALQLAINGIVVQAFPKTDQDPPHLQSLEFCVRMTGAPTSL